MNDIALIVKDGLIDIDVQSGDLLGEEGLETAILISLFTDQRIEESELPQGQTSRRGWWGDLFPDVDGDKIGSKLWLLDNAKQLTSELPRYEQFVVESLSWLIEDGVASDISASASYPERGQLKIEIDITRPEGNDSRFGFLWDGQSLKRG